MPCDFPRPPTRKGASEKPQRGAKLRFTDRLGTGAIVLLLAHLACLDYTRLPYQLPVAHALEYAFIYHLIPFDLRYTY